MKAYEIMVENEHGVQIEIGYKPDFWNNFVGDTYDNYRPSDLPYRPRMTLWALLNHRLSKNYNAIVDKHYTQVTFNNERDADNFMKKWA